MATIAVEMSHVSKKFKRGEIYDSLRDLIPALTGRWIRKAHSDVLEAQEFWALEDVCFQVLQGEAFGIIGPNGAGKSTILKHLSGIMKPTKGTIKVNGKLSALIEVGAGFHPDLTGRENVYLNGTIMGMKRAEIDVKFDQIVAFSGLEEFIDTPVKRYSSGMYARLGFSVAAHVNPDILVVDEVLSVGDWAFQQRCMEKMNSVIHGGATVIFVSHNLKAVSDLCTRSLLIDHGKVFDLGLTGDVIGSYLDRTSPRNRTTSGKRVFVANVTVRNGDGESVQFQAGQQAWVDVEVSAALDTAKVDVKIGILDQRHGDIFNASMERLGLPPVFLRAGDTYVCTFELTMHLAPGRYDVYATVERQDILEHYDTWLHAATVYVRSGTDVRGAANLYPRISKTSGP